MSTWSDAPARSSVLRGGSATTARAARLDSDLRSTPFAPAHAVDPRLTDPHLQAVVAQAVQVASEQGRAEGYAVGYAQGQAAAAVEAAAAEGRRETSRRSAETAAQARLAAVVQVLESATSALAHREAVAVAEVEDVVASLALEVARAVLDRELAVAEDPGREALARALALAPDGTPAVVRLHPQDVGLLQAADLDLSGRALQVVADPAVERGGCVVDTAGRRIDAQLTPALARVAAVLR